MPAYHYKCEPCRIIYKVSHGMNEQPEISCPECRGATERMLSAPSLNTGGHTSPTAAKYAKIGASEEIARENELQKTNQTIWLPPDVKHSPWDDEH